MNAAHGARAETVRGSLRGRALLAVDGVMWHAHDLPVAGALWYDEMQRREAMFVDSALVHDFNGALEYIEVQRRVALPVDCMHAGAGREQRVHGVFVALFRGEKQWRQAPLSVRPKSAAMCSGVASTMLIASTLAPAASCTRTTAMWSLNAALCSGVSPEKGSVVQRCCHFRA